MLWFRSDSDHFFYNFGLNTYKSISFGRFVSLVLVVPPNSQNKNGFPPQNLLPGTHLFCVYGDNWFQSVRYSQPYHHTWTFLLHPLFLRYTLRCLVAVPQDTDCVTTIKTTEEKLANKKKELEVFQVLQKAKSVMPKCLDR